jgi:plasmid stabilization system protein ParE
VGPVVSLPLILQPEAEADLAEAKKWYDGRQEGLAEEFKLGVEEVLDRIQRMPESHPEIYKGVRRCLARRFPYAVFYRVEEARTVVIAVMHTRRDPNRWRSRG